MKENRFSKSGPPADVLNPQEEDCSSLLSEWRRPVKDAPVAPKRPVKFFANWPAAADHEKSKP